MSAEAAQVRYRLANPGDVEAIAALHADSWQRAYRGMLTDEFLDNEVVDDRLRVWRERFDPVVEHPPSVTILAELRGELAGFGHSIVDEDPEWGTLLDNLHVRHDARRLGIATRLMAETAAWLDAQGSTTGLYLWVLEANTGAQQFYDALGGRVASRGTSEQAGSPPALRYYWPRLEVLSAHLPRTHRALA